ncbi:hypothetical protein D3C80_1447530 [compost metagenome]
MRQQTLGLGACQQLRGTIADHRHALQLRPVQRITRLRQRVVATAHHAHLIVHDRGEFNLLIIHPQAADAEIHLPLGQQLLHTFGGAILDADLHVRVCGHEPGQRPWQHAAGHRRYRGDADLADFMPGKQRGFTGDTVMVLDQAAKQRQAMLAEGRQLYPSPALLDQCLAQLLLQFTHGQGYRRLGAKGLAGGGMEALEFGDQYEVAQLGDLQLGQHG